MIGIWNKTQVKIIDKDATDAQRYLTIFRKNGIYIVFKFSKKIVLLLD